MADKKLQEEFEKYVTVVTKKDALCDGCVFNASLPDLCNKIACYPEVRKDGNNVIFVKKR